MATHFQVFFPLMYILLETTDKAPTIFFLAVLYAKMHYFRIFEWLQNKVESYFQRQTDRQTDRHTDRQTDVVEASLRDGLITTTQTAQ